MSKDLVGTKFTLRGKKFTVVSIQGQYANIDAKDEKTCISVGLLRQHLGRVSA